jgi:hypothetical protein
LHHEVKGRPRAGLLHSTCALAGFEIPSQLAPIVAVLIFDPEIVDIRRVGTQIEANTRRGVFCVKFSVPKPFAGQRRRTPEPDAPDMERDMKDATRKAASGALAQILAVAAMLVIAGVVFYAR